MPRPLVSDSFLTLNGIVQLSCGFMLGKAMNSKKSGWASFPHKLFACLVLAAAGLAQAQTCQTGEDLDGPTRTSLEATARRFFALAAKGDVATLRQSSIPSVA